MPTVAHLVEFHVQQRPFIQEALVRGIVNYAALAQELHDELEGELRKKIQLSAIVMALRRLSEKLSATDVPRIEFTDETSIIVRDGLVEITVERTKKAQQAISKLFEESSDSERNFVTATRGVHEITLVMNKQYHEKAKKLFSGVAIVDTVTDLSAITVTIPLAFNDTPGFFYLVTRALAWENVNLQEIVSTARELTLIVASKDVTRAFSVLKKLTN